jgi:hypothetical protein
MSRYSSKQANDEVVKYATEHPELTWREIGAHFGRSMNSVYFAALRRGYRKVRAAGLTGTSHLTWRTPKARVARVLSAKELQQKRDAHILRYVQSHPEMTYSEISEAFGLPKHVVGQVVYRSNVRRSSVTEESKQRNASIAEYVRKHPEQSYSDIARDLNKPTLYVARIARAHGLYRGKGQGPKHNYGRSFKGARWSPEDRERISQQMTAIWDKAPDSVRKRMSKALAAHWTPEARAEVSRALKSMWRAANA